MQTFEIEYTGTAKITLADEVISRVDDEWRSQLYDLHTPEEIAAHIAYNLIHNRIPLSSLDGWADMNNGQARVFDDDFEIVWMSEMPEMPEGSE